MPKLMNTQKWVLSRRDSHQLTAATKALAERIAEKTDLYGRN
jgi:hypothetical protein